MLAPIIVAALFAAPADSSENSAVESFKLELGAQAYFTRLAGNFDDGTSTVTVEDIGLHDSTIAIDASFTVHDGKFHTSLQGLSFRASGSGTAAETMSFEGITVASGDTFTSSFDEWTFGAKVAYDMWEPYAAEAGAKPALSLNAFSFTIQAIVALDFINMSRTISDTTTITTFEGNDSFLVPMVGGGFEVGFDVKNYVPLVERLEIYTDALIGGTMPLQSDGGFGMALNIDAGCRLRVTHNLAFTVGYQLVCGSYDGRDIDLTGSLQGIVVGASWKF